MPAYAGMTFYWRRTYEMDSKSGHMTLAQSLYINPPALRATLLLQRGMGGFGQPPHLVNPPWPPFIKGGNRGETMANKDPCFYTNGPKRHLVDTLTAADFAPL